MDEEYNLIITSHDFDKKEEWDAADPLITQGLLELIPELKERKIVWSITVPKDEYSTEEAVKNASYIIVAGTPSWINIAHRRFWKACIKYQKHLSFLGIGLAIPYESNFWYGRDEFTQLTQSGLIDLIVCRDKYAYYWIHTVGGFDSGKCTVLPCPAFYAFPPCPDLVYSKKNIIISIADVEETSIFRKEAFSNYYETMRGIIKDFKNSDFNVTCFFQRGRREGELSHIEEAIDCPIKLLHSPEDFYQLILRNNIYIGVRNHGALPSAGLNRPSLLLGTDYRQVLIDEIPFIGKVDMSHINLVARDVLNWYHSINQKGISECLRTFRIVSYRSWREVINPILDNLVNSGVSIS